MAMAHHAPFQGYKLHFGVTDTAIRTLRELHPVLTRTTYRTDKDLSYVLDEWAWDSWQSGKFEEIVDAGKKTLLIDLRGRADDLWCLVRENSMRRETGREKAIIIVLNTRMVEQSKADGRWEDHATRPGKPMLKLKDKLGDKVIELVKTAEEEVAPALPPPPIPGELLLSPTTTDPATLMTADLGHDEHKVAWYEGDDEKSEQKFEKEFVSKSAAVEFATALINERDVDPLDITVFKKVIIPTWVEVKRKVRIELE